MSLFNLGYTGWSDTRACQFNKTRGIPLVTDGNQTSKWKTLVEKHREYLRNAGNDKRKWQKLAVQVQLQMLPTTKQHHLRYWAPRAIYPALHEA